MACRTIVSGPGVAVIACGRGQRRESCSVQGCAGRVVKLCDFPLAGRKAGATCSRPMCASHAERVGVSSDDTVDYCPVHARLAKETTCGVCHYVHCVCPR